VCRVHLEKAATGAIIPQLVVGKPKDDVELQRLEPEDAQDEESETYEFKWQEKVFSQVEFAIYCFVFIVTEEWFHIITFEEVIKSTYCIIYSFRLLFLSPFFKVNFKTDSMMQVLLELGLPSFITVLVNRHIVFTRS